MTIWSWTPGNSEILMVCNNKQIAKRLLLIAMIFFLYCKILNCSLDFLSIWGDRQTVYIFFFEGKKTTGIIKMIESTGPVYYVTFLLAQRAYRELSFLLRMWFIVGPSELTRGD